MATPIRRFLGFHLSSGPMRYDLPHLSSLFSLYRFSTMDLRSAFSEREESSNHTILDERYVLGELSNLLPISCKTSIATTLEKDSSSRNQVAIRAADAFLSPEDKLRGVFLQNLRGRTAVEKALTDVDINLSIDIVANVVNKGNLSGEEMVTFFNWAIREHGISKDVDICNVILRALGRRKFFSHTMDLLRRMAFEGVNPNLQSLTIVMDYFIRANYVQRALKLFEECEEFGVQCDTELLNKLLRCLCERLQTHLRCLKRCCHVVSLQPRGSPLLSLNRYVAMVHLTLHWFSIKKQEKRVAAYRRALINCCFEAIEIWEMRDIVKRVGRDAREWLCLRCASI
ncbi:PREDICTED: putative pentatricopeptide repeat-containing protein At5g43820 [Tarenaya hassleriana]|uniref:putative pentatricopeptide repeat-containing protein At5g43820 n=1 Tax=Tarenaya hassleriana TaxID=28532 RepID=UPI0008FD726E|nr:PREDICTED: putative pentatricopeptide repeat-containing protein At5g43820 [Tarenaya hassleriana]XP_019056672.1 PREDICTED: putative pentatricopeptide repeat-containing protein At5g43820 [Tarenaya hassleriana]XP_019056673.1 PREDICTED: putative pentatricopeptide repeat-containing protein At5g43820 [Tarenaya hassleriana]